jgi:hypothetical protein
LKSFCVIAKKYETNPNISIFHNISINKITKINYIDFCEWFTNITNEDYKYIVDYEFYGFSLFFIKESSIILGNDYIPKYPWNSNFKNLFISKASIDYGNYLKKFRKLKKKYYKLKYMRNVLMR